MNSKIPELMEGVSKEDFEYIRLTNQRPKHVDFDKYKAIQALINKTTKRRNFQTKQYHK